MHTPTAELSPLGLAVIPAYFLTTLVIGWLSRRRTANAGQYLNASRSISMGVVAASFLSANCGALEIVGLSAMAAEYGVQAFHFYWIGAIPGMVFLALWMIPVYRQSGVHSVPEYLEVRYDRRVRLLNAYVSAIVMLMLSGISLYAMAQVLHVLVGLQFWVGALISAVVVLVYVLMGGVRATIYNEVFQLVVMVAGLAPIFVRTVGIVKSGAPLPGMQGHLWSRLPLVDPHGQMDLTGVMLGLGFVLSFSYWGTDFVQIQRALAARTLAEARQVPLWAGFGKLAFSLLVVIPGLAAIHTLPQLGTVQRFDQALPAMMTLFYSPTLLGLGLTALVASLMSGLAANISAFAAVWTQDIYRTHLRPGRTERHYLYIGKLATIVAMGIGIAECTSSFYFSNLMEQVQLIFSLFGAPFWAIFLLGMTTRRTTARGAFLGFLCGAGVSLAHESAVMLRLIRYGSIMNANFHIALYSFGIALVVASLASTEPERETAPQPAPMRLTLREGLRGEKIGRLLVLSALLLAICALLNFAWR